MYRRSLVVLSKRTVVRDPRKTATKNKLAPIQQAADEVAMTRPQQTPLPITPQQPQSVGGTLGFYMLAGAGVSVGFALVGALLG